MVLLIGPLRLGKHLTQPGPFSIKFKKFYFRKIWSRRAGFRIWIKFDDLFGLFIFISENVYLKPWFHSLVKANQSYQTLNSIFGAIYKPSIQNQIQILISVKKNIYIKKKMITNEIVFLKGFFCRCIPCKTSKLLRLRRGMWTHVAIIT